MKIMSIVGARPNFMKIAPIIEAINAYNQSQKSRGQPIDHILVHTGQHYDERLSEMFFDDFALPRPGINLGVGSASHAEQTAEIMKRFESVLLQERPDVIIVVGDVNSTIACALVASKAEYPQTNENRGPDKLFAHRAQPAMSFQIRRRPLIAHVEAGLRSFDRSMPEEINRILTDAISDFLFTTENSAIDNLLREGIPKEKIFFVGNVMIDTLLKYREKIENSKILTELDLLGDKHRNQENKDIIPFCLLTLHRPSNVDNKNTLHSILEALKTISKELPVIFPCHPRTKKTIYEFRFDSYFQNISSIKNQYKEDSSYIYWIEPLGYLDFITLIGSARLVLTDSGGIQEETTALGIPCVTLRNNTERPVTVSHGTNVVAGTEKKDIVHHAITKLNQKTIPCSPPLWDGKAAHRIIDILVRSTD
jgi:UDP-N-acetylglucosamine 2-epimerase (non-hydrolysing)